MPNAASSSSSASKSTTSQKHSKRKYSRAQLLRNLEILGTLATPLPPHLPPSPPASRSSSPNPSSKRKLSSSSELDHHKRPRTSASSDRPPAHHQYHIPAPPPTHHHFRPPNPLYSLRSEPSEDGEVQEETAVASSSRAPSAPLLIENSVPVRRPRRGKPPPSRFDQAHDKYHQYGRMLKYSGDARFWSAFPSTNKEFKPLLNPPPPNSPYHKYCGLIARLELIDALVCFTYAIWCKDYGRQQCQKDTWGTVESFLNWCRHKWQADNTVGDREKAFLGLIWMIEAFIHARMFTYSTSTHINAEVDKLLAKCRSIAAATADENASTGPSGTLSSQPTPPMLPSPASIAPTSANSTPIGRANGTPNTATSSSASGSNAHTQSPPNTLRPLSSSVALSGAAAAGVTVPISASLTQTLKDQSKGILAAKFCMEVSQKTMTLPVMALHFPATFARMVHSSLLPHEEHEPDIEDEEGELFWPGGCVTGEGLGWVCLMGKAMISEFGKGYGYRGLDGVVPKPKPEEQGPETPSEGPSHNQGPSQPAGQASVSHVASSSTDR